MANKKVEPFQGMISIANNKLIWLGVVIFTILISNYILKGRANIKLDELGAYLGIVIGIITLGLGIYQTWLTAESGEETRVNNAQQTIDLLKIHIDKQLRHIDERIDESSKVLAASEVRTSSLENISSKYQSQIDERLYRIEQQAISLRHDYNQLQINLRHHEEQIGHKETQLQLFNIQKELANLNVVTSAQTRYNSIGLRTDYLQQELTAVKEAISGILKSVTSPEQKMSPDIEKNIANYPQEN